LSAYDIHGVFIPVAGRRLFALSHRPVAAARGGVLLVPPFGDEMNKCRRMLALVAQGLAGAGIWSVLPDLRGTGDSEGEFEAGSWSDWKEDLRGVAAAFSGEGWSLTSLLGIRCGAALGLEAARENGWSLTSTVLWQPVVDGARFLTQFLRTRVAASLMEDRKETVADLNRRLASGEVLEIAGYPLTARLTGQLEDVRLSAALGPHAGKVTWLEVHPEATTELPPASRACIDDAHARGVGIDQSIVAGEPFWTSTEIVVNPQLVSRTIAMLASVS
jgi:exosortase A-associated hydrolase 2